MKKFFTFAALALVLVGCKNTAPLLPTVSGKAGEVLVVIEKNDWDGQLGEDVRGVLADEYPFLPVQEARYSVANVSHGGFIEMFQVHRNIVFFDINPQAATTGVKFLKDKWATPQCVILVSAHTAGMADSLFLSTADMIVEAIEKAERERVIANTRKYENTSVTRRLPRCSEAPSMCLQATSWPRSQTILPGFRTRSNTLPRAFSFTDILLGRTISLWKI